jgi:GNAT superfamily N-acetyltransferase
MKNKALDKKFAIDKTGASGIEVRPAIKADYPSLLSIMAEIERQHVDALPQIFRASPQNECVKMLDEILADNDAVLLVAEKNGEVIGYINLCYKKFGDDAMLVPRYYVGIRDLAVARKHHRSGAGSVLMQAAENWARERGAATLELNVWDFNSGAFAFYQEMGFSDASHHMWKYL